MKVKDCRVFEEYLGEEKVMTEAKIGMYCGIVIPSVLHGSETWEIKAGLRK